MLVISFIDQAAFEVPHPVHCGRDSIYTMIAHPLKPKPIYLLGGLSARD